MAPRTSANPARRIRPKRQYTHDLTYRVEQGWRDRFPTHKIVGVFLVLLAAALVVTHQAEHAGVIALMPRNLEDLLIGFPMAGIVGIAGFIALIWR